MAPKAITKPVDTFHELFDKYGPTKITENDIEIDIKDQIENAKREFIDGISEIDKFSNSNYIIHLECDWLYLISTKLSCEIYTKNSSEILNNLRIFLGKLNWDKALIEKPIRFKLFHRADFRLLAYEVGDTLFLATRGTDNPLNGLYT